MEAPTAAGTVTPFRVTIDGVPKNGNSKDSVRWLKKWGIADEDVAKVKKVHRKASLQVTATSAEAEARIVALLNGRDSGKGRTMKVVPRDAAKRGLEDEDGKEEADNEESGEGEGKSEKKRGKFSNDYDGEGGAAAAVVHDVRDVVTPLWKVPYEQQMVDKNKELGQILHKMRRKTVREGGKEKTADWPMATIVHPMPMIANGGTEQVARNKLSFTIGNDDAGKICIGFRVGRTEHGSTAVADPSAVVFCAPAALAVRGALQSVLEEPGALPAKNNLSHKGFWRQLEVRTNLAGQSLAVVQVDETGVDPTLVEATKQHVKRTLLERVPGLIGLGWQQNSSLSNGATTEARAIEYLHGDGYLNEKLGNVLFLIPPAAFFQTNSERVVPLYDMVTEAVAQEARRLASNVPIRVFDVCCGIGTIGLYMRSKIGSQIGEVVGIDIEPTGIEAAKQNAELNKLQEGISFIASPAEKVLPTTLKGASPDTTIIAVVDPPRAGLHSDVTRALRNCAAVKSIVYVSCNPKSLVTDCVPLCKPTTKRFEHAPFVPTFMSGVDMFPHTTLMESVVIFQRQ